MPGRSEPSWGRGGRGNWRNRPYLRAPLATGLYGSVRATDRWGTRAVAAPGAPGARTSAARPRGLAPLGGTPRGCAHCSRVRLDCTAPTALGSGLSSGGAAGKRARSACRGRLPHPRFASTGGSRTGCHAAGPSGSDPERGGLRIPASPTPRSAPCRQRAVARCGWRGRCDQQRGGGGGGGWYGRVSVCTR